MCHCSCGRQTPRVTTASRVTAVTTRTSGTDIRSVHINAEIFIICFLAAAKTRVREENIENYIVT